MAEPERERVFARRVADPEVVQAIEVFLTTMPPHELEHLAETDGNIDGRIMRVLGPVAWLGPTGVRMVLGAERVGEFAQYGEADFLAILEALADSRPAHGAILRANVDWYLRQMARLRDLMLA